MLTPELAKRAADVIKRARSVINSMEARSAGTGVQHHNEQLHGDMFRLIYELEQSADQGEAKEGGTT